MRTWQFASFISDRWQVSPKLTVNLGLRWELFPGPTPSYPGGLSNYDPASNTLVLAGLGSNPMNMGVKNRLTYFAPRTGIAYRLRSTTVIRAGFGISFNTPCTDQTCETFNYPVRSNNVYQPLNSGSYTPAILPDGRTASFELGFPAPVAVPIPADGIIRNPDPNSVYVVTPRDLKAPYVESWNLAVQHALPFNLVLDVAYVGSHGVGMPASVDLNAGRVIGAGGQGRPLYPRTASTTQWFQGFSSTYHALQTKLDRKFRSGLQLTTALTWQKAMAFQSGDDGGLLFYVGTNRNYARTDFDRTLSLTQSYVYQLPVGKGQRWAHSGAAAAVVGGWQVSGLLTATTGTPMTVSANSAALNLPGTTQTADQVAPLQVLHGINLGNPWFSTASFKQPVGAVFGTSGKNIFDGPGLFRLNLSLFRIVALRESVKLELRGEAINATNTAQFANPNTSLTAGTFGYVTSTLSSGAGVNGVGGGRALQLGVKVSF